MIDYLDLALRALVPNPEYSFVNSKINWDVQSNNGVECPSEKEINNKIDELKAEYEANQYQRDRLAEYPSIQELVVALYDADDKAEIDKKRAEIKKKYPKPE